MKKANLFIDLLTEVLDCAGKEERAIFDGKESPWDLKQIQEVVIPETNELLSYAKKGEAYFKYGRHERLLESAYLITDSLNDLAHTDLGECILKVQDFYDKL